MVGIVGLNDCCDSVGRRRVNSHVFLFLTMANARAVDGLPGLAVGKSQLIRRDANHLAIFLMQGFQDLGQSACDNGSKVWNARSGEELWAGESREGVEVDIVYRVSNEVYGSLVQRRGQKFLSTPTNRDLPVQRPMRKLSQRSATLQRRSQAKPEPLR